LFELSSGRGSRFCPRGFSFPRGAPFSSGFLSVAVFGVFVTGSADFVFEVGFTAPEATEMEIFNPCLGSTLAFFSSIRFCQILMAGAGASCNIFAGFDQSLSVGFFLSPPAALSSASADFSAVFEVCDLSSQVDSEEAFGIDTVSSSLTKVEVDDATKSGDGGVMLPLS
jgi:hypothetical protein